MILSNVEIHRAIDEGRLVIKPEPPRTPSISNPDWPYNTTSVDLRLGNNISVPKGGPYTYDLRKGGIARFLKDHFEDISLDRVGSYTLDPNKFVLSLTLEHIELPIIAGRQSLAARIEGRSSFARCGLLVHFTAPTVHAGFRGTLTLEMINLGANAITLWPGMPICQLILEEVRGTPIENPSQFQNQSTPSGVS